MNHYETLGIQPDATAAEIKAAWKSFSQKRHPDKGGDTETFKQGQEAYETLSNIESRDAYDKQQSEQLNEVETILAAKLEEFVGKGFGGDIVANVRAHLKAQQRALVEEIDRLGDELDDTRKDQGRIKTKSRNLYELLLSKRIEQLERQITQREEMILKLGEAVSLADTYTDSLAAQAITYGESGTVPTARQAGNRLSFSV